MNIALILAGGSGHRMGQDIPKQFLTVMEKPVVIYTLENFERCAEIDGIVVVCIDGWHDVLSSFAHQFDIKKLIAVISGGETAQASIRKGVEWLAEHYDGETTVVIHDGIRPLVDEDVLDDVIRVCHEKGNAVTSMPYNEQIFLKTDDSCTAQYIPRETVRRVSTPQAYSLSKLQWAYDEACRRGVGLGGSSYVNTMMCDLGETLYFAKGSDKNIKLTTKDDFYIFKAYIQAKKDNFLK